MPDPADRVATTLSGIRERAEGPMRKFGDIDASQADVRILLAAIEAVLKLTRDGDGDDLYPSIDLTVGDVRETITAALTGKEAGDGV